MTANDRDAARPATEGDEHAPGVLGDVPPVSGARLARYAEAAEAIGTYLMGAMAEATVGVREVDGWEKVAAREAAREAAQQWLAPLVDAEQAEILDRAESAEAEVERWVEKANEAGKAYADANTKHHEELDRANRLEGMCERLAERAVEYQDAQRAAEAALASEREAHAVLRARLEALADGWATGDVEIALEWNVPIGETFSKSLRAALAAEPAAPVAAEEGGEQEAGESRPVPEFSPRSHNSPQCSCGAPDAYSLNPAEMIVHSVGDCYFAPAPSGSDEQGNRPATPDANGVHDTTGGE